jgi:hypothetical protein
MKKLLLIVTLFLLVTESCKKSKNTAPIVPAEGLVSYFNFDDNLLDQTGYSTSGTAKFTYTTGKKGKAIQFNGVDELVEFTPQNPVNHSNLSLAFWVKSSESGSTKYFIYRNNFGVATSSSKIKMVIANPGTNAVSSNTFVADQWVHVVGTYDGTNIKIYINGEWVATQNHPGTITGFAGTLSMGFANGGYWAGSLDEVYIYNRVLTDAEIKTLYQL